MHTAPPTGGGFREVARLAGILTLLVTALLLCFCSLLPTVLLLSFLFNAVILGSSLFATLAQEREKRTIDALRLTQLSSLDILMLKSRRELRTWAKGNTLLLGLMLLAGWLGGEPMGWVFTGAVALAAGGLLSIALALAVSTRSETTSSAVVSGWVTKGVWLAGLPLLDYVVEAVLVLKEPTYLFRYLDPAWVAWRVTEASFFEVGGLSMLGLWVGAVATVVLAGLAVLQSSRLIDASFEVAGSLEDRHRHSAYERSYPFSLEKNPFFVRELAWQMRTGAGRWPGYAVFITLFLAPFLYGVAQNQRGHQPQTVKIVREDVMRNPSVPSKASATSESLKVSSHDQACFSRPPELLTRAHSGLCLSKLMGLPAARQSSGHDLGYKTVMTAGGHLERVSEVAFHEQSEVRTRKRSSDGEMRGSYRHHQSYFHYELGRGLLTGLLLTVIYLFVRGGAFMAGSITGEKERRAWDQIALTGVSAETFVSGKLAAVLSFPLRQMLMATPVLALFAAYGVLSWFQLGLVMTMLSACFIAAGALGIATSTLSTTSHQAQGRALGAAAAILVLPLFCGFATWPLLMLTLVVLFSKTRLSAGSYILFSGGSLLAVLVGGAAVSPVGAVLTLSGSGIAKSNIAWALGGASGVLLWSALSMLGFAAMFYLAAVRNLESGGSVKV